MIVISLDPGRTTGAVKGTIDIVTGTWTVVTALELLFDMKFIHDWIHLHVPEIIIVESFHLARAKALQQSGSVMEAPEVIGAIKLSNALLSTPAKLVFQLPSFQHRVTVLAEHAPLVSKSPHTISAYKHLRYWCIRGRPSQGA